MSNHISTSAKSLPFLFAHSVSDIALHLMNNVLQAECLIGNSVFCPFFACNINIKKKPKTSSGILHQIINMNLKIEVVKQVWKRTKTGFSLNFAADQEFELLSCSGLPRISSTEIKQNKQTNKQKTPLTYPHTQNKQTSKQELIMMIMVLRSVSLLSWSLTLRVPPVHHQCGPSDHGGLVTQQEQDSVGHIGHFCNSHCT